MRFGDGPCMPMLFSCQTLFFSTVPAAVFADHVQQCRGRGRQMLWSPCTGKTRGTTLLTDMKLGMMEQVHGTELTLQMIFIDSRGKPWGFFPLLLRITAVWFLVKWTKLRLLQKERKLHIPVQCISLLSWPHLWQQSWQSYGFAATSALSHNTPLLFLSSFLFNTERCFVGCMNN